VLVYFLHYTFLDTWEGAFLIWGPRTAAPLTPLQDRPCVRWRRRRTKKRDQAPLVIQLINARPDPYRHDLHDAPSERAPICLHPKLTGDVQTVMHGDEQPERGVGWVDL
jgi:hypothetical protein